MNPMTKQERIYAATKFEATDKVPYSFWSHMPDVDLDPVALAERTYQFYKKYDLDFIKTMNNGMYAIEDFGCQVDYSDVAKGGVAKTVTSPIETPADWLTLKPTPYTEGSLARELLSLKLLLEKVKDENVPVIFTVFSPITTADKLSRKKVKEHIENGHSAEVKQALEVIAQSTAALAKEAIRLGAAGVFFASQMSSYDVTDLEFFREFGKPYDLQVLDACDGGWLNTIHAHGTNIMFDVVRDYPVNVFNWHAWESLPTIAEAQALTGKCLMGGLDRRDIHDCKRNEVLHQIFEAYKATNGKGLILTPGCVIRHPLNDDMLAYIRSAKELVEKSPIIRV